MVVALLVFNAFICMDCRWVPYNLVRSHLDDSPFVCLSDVALSKALASENGGKVPRSEHEDKEEVEAM
jgi:hypothetical protein